MLNYAVNVLWEFDITIADGTAHLIFDGSTALRTMPPMQLTGIRLTNDNAGAGSVFVGTNGVDALTTAHYWKVLGPQTGIDGTDCMMGRGAIAQLAVIGDGTNPITVHCEVLQ
jgi:hypothetical protein